MSFVALLVVVVTGVGGGGAGGCDHFTPKLAQPKASMAQRTHGSTRPALHPDGFSAGCEPSFSA